MSLNPPSTRIAARFLKPGRSSHADLAAVTSLIASHGRAGDAAAAREVFDAMPNRDVVAWNAMLTAYARAGEPRAALALFARMSAPRPDAFSLTASLAAAADLRSPGAGAQLHALLVRLGFSAPLPVGNALVAMYAKCSRPADAARAFGEMRLRNALSWCSLLYGYLAAGLFSLAHQVFDEMPMRNTVAWNTLLSGYSRTGNVKQCVLLFKDMRVSGLECDDATFCVLVDACVELSEPSAGFIIHKLIVQSGWNAAAAVDNSLLTFYSKFGLLDDALRIFDSMESRTVVSWNAMIDAWMRFGDTEQAVALFRSVPETNVISWTAMIGGFARNGCGDEAFALFLEMMRASLRPDDFTFGAVLHSRAMAACLASGRMVHGCAFRSGFTSYSYVANSLVDMYAKCGDVNGAGNVFDAVIDKDIVAWNTMLFGFAINGSGNEALALYDTMLACGVRPDEVTFIGLLTACSHSGFLEPGRASFESMVHVHGLQPSVEHLACILDMYARGGKITEGVELLDSYSKTVKTDGRLDMSEALLSACCECRDVGVGRKVGEEMVAMEPSRDVGYVMLSNLYSASGQWKEAEKVRRAMAEHGVKKSPGCSWIEVKGAVKVFVSGGQDLDHIADAAELIWLLNYEMRNCANCEE